MRLNHLSLTNFRNYARLELDLQTPITILQGRNAQGKTNLLEAIVILATSRSPIAMADRELVNWLALEDLIPVARLVAEIERANRQQKIELSVVAQEGRNNNGPSFRKQIRINGVPRRALSLVGLLPVVLFLPQDIELVSGSPSVRRRYLDIALCQMDAAYCRSLAQYNRILAQRNALLRHLREEGGPSEQLRLWDERLVKHGSQILWQRQGFIAELNESAQERHEALTTGQERLRLIYQPGLAMMPSQADGQATLAVDMNIGVREEIATVFRQQLGAEQGKEIAAGLSLFGPHRDEVNFEVDGRELRLFGSRGQQRTASLSVKLAEVEVMTHHLGEPPLLLLDDIMSELDAERRAALLTTMETVPQAICSTTDWDDFAPEFRQRATCLCVEEGRINTVQDGMERSA